MNNEIVMPNYDNSILNTITSILKYYNVETNHTSLATLDEKLNSKNFNNIIFIVLDGMGEHILNAASPDGFFKQKEIECITSVYPSTTTAAITTYYSGKPPFETGWIAWSQYFKEYGRAVDMLSHMESYQHKDLKDARMNVFKEVVNYESIFEQIEKASGDVKAFELVPEYSDRRAKRSIRANNIDEAIINIEDICMLDGKKFIFAYSDNPDGILHKFGAYSDEAQTFIRESENKIKALSEKLNDSLIIVSADHGHKDIEKVYQMLDYPEINECLFMPVSLESRCVSFWVKEDMKDEFVKRFKNVFGDDFYLMTKDEFLDKHFLGYGIKHKKIDEFIGNYVALSIGSSIIRLETYLAEGKSIKKSTHCGLTKEEMEVPVIVI